MHHRIFVLALAALSVSGCTFASKTYAPDGRQAFSISCDGLANSWAGCFKKAGSICMDKGYDTFTQNGDSGVLVNANPQVPTSTSVVTRSLIIACKLGPKESAN